jgi:hypothetical protein
MSYLGTQPLGGQIISEFFSGTGSATTYTLNYPYGNEASTMVFISGVKQATNTYAVINGQLVFTEAPPAGTNNIEVIYLGGRIMTNPYLAADTYGIIRINANTITENCTITTGYNGSSAGPVTVANNRVVTIANNSVWTIF